MVNPQGNKIPYGWKNDKKTIKCDNLCNAVNLLEQPSSEKITNLLVSPNEENATCTIEYPNVENGRFKAIEQVRHNQFR